MKLHGKASHFDEKRERLQVDEALERYTDLSGKDIIVINDDGEMRHAEHALGTTLKARQPRVRKALSLALSLSRSLALSLSRSLALARALSLALALALSLARAWSRSRSQARQPGVMQVRTLFSGRAEHVVCRRRSAPLNRPPSEALPLIGCLQKRSP